ncbi:MAG: sugar phosphate isomerase/epimerase [Candidatus Latescibacteria bacterium]|jgi:sugar phosphate isomerase/epimerase|nr:sugar phosphate isomerase/epimerase [Candidatus Latescibacterota bacterium]
MDIAFFADEVSKADFEEAVRLGIQAGADGVELRGGIWGRRVQEIDDDEVKRVQDVLAKHGTSIISLGSPFGKCAHDSEAEKADHQRIFDRMVELSHAFDTRIVRCFSLWNPFRKQGDEMRPEVDAYLDVICPFLEPAVATAQREGIVLSLENEGATIGGTCAEVASIVAALGDPQSLTFCWDVNNGVALGEPALPEGYGLIRGRISHLHVKPNEAGELDPVLGTEISYLELLKTMVADGYKGAASIEHWGSPEDMLRGVRLLRAAVDELGASG